MFGLSFESTPAVEPAHPARADIALFIGWTTRRAAAPLPRPIGDWLRARRYADDPSLLDVPVPIDTWTTFDALFDWHARPLGAATTERCDDYLGLAVRDFFANGGRKAYVLRLGDPWPVSPQIDGAARAARLAKLLPPAGESGWMRESWRGIEQAWALDDVSLVLVPDLPDLFGDARTAIAGDRSARAGGARGFRRMRGDATCFARGERRAPHNRRAAGRRCLHRLECHRHGLARAPGAAPARPDAAAGRAACPAPMHAPRASRPMRSACARAWCRSRCPG